MNVCVPCGVFCLRLSVSITLHNILRLIHLHINATHFMKISRYILVELYVWVWGRLFICSLKVDYLMEDFLRVRWDRTLMCLLEYGILKQMDSSITTRAGLCVTLCLCLKRLFPVQLRQQQNSSPKAISTIQSRLVVPKAPYMTSARGWTWRESWWFVFSPALKAKKLGTFSNGNDLPADTWWQPSLI